MGKMKAASEELPALERQIIAAENGEGTGTLRGAVELGPMRTVYVLYADGTAGKIVTNAPVLDWVREGREVTEAEYEAARGELVEARDQHFAGLIATDEANASADYRELRAAGISEATARRMTGYAGEGTAP